MLREFKDFQTEAKLKEIPTPADLVSKLLDDYFASTPPFGTGKKQKEFPDAISLHAAAAFANKKPQTVAVISDDLDVKKACGHIPLLQSVDGVEDVMAEIISARTLLGSTIESVKSFLAKAPKYLLLEIEESFGRLNFYRLGGRGGIIEVYGAAVTSLREGAVLGVDADQVLAAVRADIKFSAEVSWIEDHPPQRRSEHILNHEVEVRVDQ